MPADTTPAPVHAPDWLGRLRLLSIVVAAIPVAGALYIMLGYSHDPAPSIAFRLYGASLIAIGIAQTVSLGCFLRASRRLPRHRLPDPDRLVWWRTLSPSDTPRRAFLGLGLEAILSVPVLVAGVVVASIGLMANG